MRVARRGSGRLIIFHAVHLNLTPYGPANPGWLRAALCREALEKMEELMAEARRMEIPAVSVIEEGAPAEAILRATLRWQVELMVMTSPRGGRLSRLFAGGIHDKLARLAKCPVVVVRPEAAEKAEP